MAIIIYNKTWESEFDDIVSKNDKVQDLKINQLKLKVNDAYREDEKITTNFEPTDNSDVINKTYLEKRLSKIEGQISYIEKVYNELKSHNNKQSAEEFLSERALKTTIQMLYDKGLFNNYDNAGEVLKDFFIEVKQRRRPFLDPNKGYHSVILFTNIN